MGYRPIETYGVIGDLQSVALVEMEGSIDWCCLPRFDSPSVFARILDDSKGGHFQICAIQDGRHKQMYMPDTNVLVTRFLSADGVGEVTDFMPVHKHSGGQTEGRTRQIIRIAKSVLRRVRFRLECVPAFDYARQPHTVERYDWGVRFCTPAQTVTLLSPIPLTVQDSGGVEAEFYLEPNESFTFALIFEDGTGSDARPEGVDGDRLLTETVRFWRAWLSHCKYHGRWREMVTRSALVLKLLTYEPTGAVVAAPTCSLPEEIGGQRNWDYRYTWVRDAAFSVYALMRLGYTEEAAAFTSFMQMCPIEERENGPLDVLYGIDGRHDIAEHILDHLDGYKGSKPVRIGNGAVNHLQLDIYGELMDSIYLHDKYGTPLGYDAWTSVERMLDWVTQNWERADQSIWEVRGGAQQFTYSKLQCWVALDRGLRLATKRSFPIGSKDWQSVRDSIYRRIMTDGWDPRRRTFLQYFGSDAVDASVLMFPLMLFISPTDPRMLSTLDTIQRELVSDSLVYRYDTGKAARDGLPGGEGTFSVCTFWLVEALTRAGYLEQAQFQFEKMLTYANHLGLFGEQLSPAGETLGNFPQAFTHLGLISAAFNLNKRLG